MTSDSAPLTLVCGGQTGVDRAALEVAMERGMPCGGWARRLGRPLYLWHLDAPPDPDAFRRWLQVHNIRTLNVAGPRESESPGVYAMARDYLRAVLP